MCHFVCLFVFQSWIDALDFCGEVCVCVFVLACVVGVNGKRACFRPCPRDDINAWASSESHSVAVSEKFFFRDGNYVLVSWWHLKLECVFIMFAMLIFCGEVYAMNRL